jgi:glycerophosphoryl diester phosphodiesterase
MRHCKYLSHEHPVRLAHRGSSILWPENTITAFQEAVNLGCRYIETDLHVTKDGTIVTFHDDRLERVTNGTGLIKEWTWDDLCTLDAAYHFKPEQGFPYRDKGIRIPSLEEAMEAFPHVMFNVDLKQPGIEEAVAHFIKKHNYEERILIASFYDKRIRRFRMLSGSTVPTSTGRWETMAIWACSRIGRSFHTSAAAVQVPARQGWLTVVDEKFIEAVHAIGVQVHVWVVNDPDEMQRLFELGVDGIVTDRIDLPPPMLGVPSCTARE